MHLFYVYFMCISHPLLLRIQIKVPHNIHYLPEVLLLNLLTINTVHDGKTQCHCMCCHFAGIAGVYDIETHYKYEYGRGVAELSTMKRAMGGRNKFASQSPALILNSACGNKAKMKLPGKAPSAVASRYGPST